MASLCLRQCIAKTSTKGGANMDTLGIHWRTYKECMGLILQQHSTLTATMHETKILYSGELLREETFANWWKGDFRGLLAFAAPKDTMPQKFTEKTFTNSHKTAKFAKVSPSKVSRYTGTQRNSLWLLHGTIMGADCAPVNYSICVQCT